MIGETISHYKVSSKLGAGGMGEVYRARDTNLDRDVALKILPEALIGDADRLARFEREAKILAGLNHSNIAQVYGLEGSGATRAIVMELVDGRDLAAAIGETGLPLEDALPFARQIAGALEAAHEQGVIHRDLKPANVMLTADEQVKVLDFGLAKATDASVSSSSGETVDLLTVTTAPTAAGVILGTAAYMSPEQARGKVVDKRTDIWAFGCVLYEMITGKRPFDGETMTDVLAAVVRAEPDWEALRLRSTPPRLVRLIQRCLKKDPRERLRDIGDASLMLAEIASGDDGRVTMSEAAAVTDLSGRWKILTAFFALVALALAMFSLGPWGARSSEEPSAESSVSAMTLLTDFTGFQRSPSLSPDGKQLLYVAEDGGDLDIFLLRVGGQNAVNLTEGFDSNDDHPSWSPDGEQIAFDSDRDGGGIFIMGATGESPGRLVDAGFHPNWSPDGARLTFGDENLFDPYSRARDSKLQIVDVESGARSAVPIESDAVQGRWSPDGRWIAFWTSEGGRRDIRLVADDGTSEYIKITDDGATDWEPQWAPDGRALYFISDRGGSPDLWKITVNPVTGQPEGRPTPITTGVAHVASFSLAADGKRIALGISKRVASVERIAFDPDTERPIGEAEMVFASESGIEQFSLSRDGQRIAYRSGLFQEDLFTVGVDGADRRRLTDDAARDRGPQWGPNDDWIIFYSNRSGDYDHWLIGADGTGLRRITNRPGTGTFDPYWSNDGARIAGIVIGHGSVLYEADPIWFEREANFEPLFVELSLDGFTVTSWSQNDRFFSGCDGSTLIGDQIFFEIGTKKMTMIRRDDGSVVNCRTSFEFGSWIDDERFLMWDRVLDGAVIYNVPDKSMRVVPGIPGPSAFQVSADGRTIYLQRRSEDAEVWMLER